MDLRPVRVDDAAAIADYQHRCWLEGYVGLVDQDVLDSLDVGVRIDAWRRVLAADADRPMGQTAMRVAVDADDRPIASVRVDGDTITNLYVDPQVWAQGIGRRLLGVGEELLVDHGHRRGVLWTLVRNTRAIALYESAGWRLDGTQEVHVSSVGVPVDELRLVKDLVG